ncbi:hypothetical protein SAMN05880574_11556 [Chryseobacterium sp. RU37D]|uniref:hypothetical protein n=1 Tax=Chryseobacterium sp. RU37D TaxID=1907397 RepID=UPI000954B624|nr:hypothetical protein [Chryseobacterium sp. RU37D]SIQ52562.1 hypothetical protein SAMN05880574_11556 [Chryseobacterium sp. RU37D]
MEYLRSSDLLRQAIEILANAVSVRIIKSESNLNKFLEIKGWAVNSDKINSDLKKNLIKDLSSFDDSYHKLFSIGERTVILKRSKYFKQSSSAKEMAEKILAEINEFFILSQLQEKIEFLKSFILHLIKNNRFDKIQDKRNKIKNIKSNLRYIDDEEESMLKVRCNNFITNINSYSLWKSNKLKIQLMTYY